YFSTYAPESYVNVSSLSGTVTFRLNGQSDPQDTTTQPLLYNWLRNVLAYSSSSVSHYRPWLRLSETGMQAFQKTVSLMPATLRPTAFTGNINIMGDLTLFPAPRGTVELVAGNAINGLQIAGIRNLVGGAVEPVVRTAEVNLSDANPQNVP